MKKEKLLIIFILLIILMYVFLSFCIPAFQLQKLYISNYDRIISLLRTAIFSKVIISSVISLTLIVIIRKAMTRKAN